MFCLVNETGKEKEERKKGRKKGREKKRKKEKTLNKTKKHKTAKLNIKPKQVIMFATCPLKAAAVEL